MTSPSEQQAVPVAQSPASIWLSPICDETADHGEGRTWASPAPDAECEDCGLPWVEYVRADLAPVSDATQTREAEAWVPRIGDLVKVSDSCEHSSDWQRTDLWVAGVAVDERCRGINVTVTEQWPVPHRFVGRDYMGHTDGFLVARTDGKLDDLEPRASLNARDGA